MSYLQFTLLSDGSSDRALIPVLHWLTQQHWPDRAIDGRWADLRYLRKPPRDLVERIVRAVHDYPCDLLFIHRDAETADHRDRVAEIQRAVETVRSQLPRPVPVVPVRMTEAWLLFDEVAIRQAAGNPSGATPLVIPAVDKLDQHPDPKALLQRLLLDASELRGRRRAQFPVSQAVHRLADVVESFAPLRRLEAFRAVESELIRLARAGTIG